METLQTACSHRGEQSTGNWWDYSDLDYINLRYTHYTNAPTTVFVPVGTVVDAAAVLLNYYYFFVDNTCEALLADQLGIVLAWRNGSVGLPQKTPLTI